jgi:hypothetical protein
LTPEINDALIGDWSDITNMKELGMNFVIAPEFDYNNRITVDEALVLLNQDLTASDSLLNPLVMHAEILADK